MSTSVNTSFHLGGSVVESATTVRFFDDRPEGDFTSIAVRLRTPGTHISHELHFFDMPAEVATEVGTALIQYAGGVREREQKKAELSLISGGESEAS